LTLLKLHCHQFLLRPRISFLSKSGKWGKEKFSKIVLPWNVLDGLVRVHDLLFAAIAAEFPRDRMDQFWVNRGNEAVLTAAVPASRAARFCRPRIQIGFHAVGRRKFDREEGAEEDRQAEGKET
jgi:hypothetical protein